MSVARRYLGTTLALLAVAFAVALVGGWDLLVGGRPAPSIGRAPTPARRPPAPVPAARELLDRADDLGLSREQRARLDRLARDWEREAAAMEARLEAAAAEFARFMDEARGGRARMEEIERRSADVSVLGGRLRELRRLHGEAALAVLDGRQRERARRIPEETR